MGESEGEGRREGGKGGRQGSRKNEVRGGRMEVWRKG
jgi:hypothetical protein